MLIVLEDDDGLPHSPALAREQLHHSVCIGSVRSLPLLVTLVESGAVALNQDAPFTMLVRAVLHALSRPPEAPATTSRQLELLRGADIEQTALAHLTRAERDTLAGLMRGRSAAQLARESRRSIHTVRSQIRAVLAKLGVDSQLHAVAIAHQAGLAEWHEGNLHFTNFGDARNVAQREP